MANFNIIVTFSHPAAVSNTIAYARIDNTGSPVYITIPGITTSPYVIQNVPQGQYRILITPIYADGRVCGATQQDTAACTGVTAFSAVYDAAGSPPFFVISYSCNPDVPDIQINIGYPNGGFVSNQYANTGVDIDIPVPNGLSGSFTFTIQPVCDAVTGWLGVASAPAVVFVPPPSNSLFTNNTGNPLTNVSGVSFDGGSVLLFTVANIVNTASVNYFINDGIYTSIVINFTGTVASGALVTGTGTYAGVVSGGTVTFSNVTVSGGMVITLS